MGQILLLGVLMIVSAGISIQPTSAASTAVTFGAAVNLSGDAGSSTTPVVATSGTYVYVAWIDKTPGHAEVFFRANSNYGAANAWGSVIQFAQKGNALNVQIKSEGTHVLLTWQEGGGKVTPTPYIEFAQSSNNGASFGPTVNLSIGTGLAAEDEVFAASGSNVYVTWTVPPKSGIGFAASHDYGVSFSAPTILANLPGDHEQAVAAWGSYVYVVWGPGASFVVSKDAGATFSSVTEIGSGSREAMIVASANDVYVTWTSETTGSYQAYVAVSQNHGSSFTVTNLSGNFLSAREVQLAANGTNVYVTYRGQATTNTVNQYINVSNNNGTSFGLPIDLAAQTQGQTGFGGVIASGSNVYAMWPHSDSSGISQMYFSASQDSGSTWGGLQQLSASSTGATGMNDPGDAGPMLATGNGHVFVVWPDTSVGSGDIIFRSS